MTERRIAALALATGMALSGAAAAQPAPSVSAITPEQRAQIKQHVRVEGRSSVLAPSGFVPAVGAVLPPGIELFWMPIGAGVNRYRYVAIGQRVLIVEPESRRVIELFE